MRNFKFLELGAANLPALIYLLYPNWQTVYEDLRKKASLMAELPLELLAVDGEWEGWFVEPNPEHCLEQMLSKHMALPNAHFIQGAVHGTSGFETLKVFTSKTQNWVLNMSSVIPGYYNCEDFTVLSELTLKTFTLDELLLYINETPTLVRMDIEGSEKSVLENYSWKWLPEYWQIDMHGEHIEWATGTFKMHGYEVLGTTFGVDKEEIWVRKKQG